MSTLRPECKDSSKPLDFSDNAALRRIYAATKKRRGLSFGKLDAKDGHCAMGCFWKDNPGTVVTSALIEQVAAVNDSVPPTATRKERRQHVLRWLEYKLGL